MSFTEEEARERLLKSWKWEDHPDHCREQDYYFETETEPYEDSIHHDGIIIIKCWNCEMQDHLLYDNHQ